MSDLPIIDCRRQLQREADEKRSEQGDADRRRCGAAALLAAGTAAVFAQQGDKAAIVKARKDFMTDQQHAVNAINAFAKGTGERQGAIDGANKLLELSSKIDAKFIDTYFPAGTSSADMPG